MKPGLLVVLLCLVLKLSFGQKQDYPSIEKYLQNYYDKLSDWEYEFNDTVNSKGFTDTLRKVLARPSSFSYPFDSLNTHPMSFVPEFNVLVAPDNRLRIFTWNDWQGGTWRSINSLFQYKRTEGTIDISVHESDPAYDSYKADIFYYSLDTFSINGKRHYVTHGGIKHCGTCFYSIVEFFKEVKGQIVPARVVQFRNTISDNIFISPWSDSPEIDTKNGTIQFHVTEPEMVYAGDLKSKKLIILKLKNGKFRKH